ncbi:UPF0223 family protein [Pisciglobus halotolerans]|uniref:Uncharacterized protein YktA, UPF0223 family n=1 Tax=Pisciglobus halotolerans TaxID=745365 RepID=A0A1I3BEY7_9LACT|nr:UPF0223 family protein [Pisciglobus halotolerans]SFH60710.1 Uncharacterized protein YktA, UPF0223 family [Pisciglobus halotolerans]
MEKSYAYPIDYDWTREEMITVVDLWRMVENAYEKEIDRKLFLDQYRKFKAVVPSKGEEKKWDSAFENVSGYSLYRTVQEAKNGKKEKIKMK